MNDVGQLLSWRGLLRIIPLYFVLMAIYNYSLAGQGQELIGLLIATVEMTAVLTVATVAVLFVIVVSNRGGVQAWQAQREAAAGDRAGAIKRYDEALRRNPNLAEALVSRAELLSQAGQTRQARADLDRAIGVTPHVINFPNPLLLRAYIERGRLRDADGDRNGAMDDWLQGSRAVPGAPDPYILRGRTALEQGDWINGRRLVLQGIELLSRRLQRQGAGETDRAAQLNMRGLAYNLLGEHRSAMADLEQALTIAPDSWVAHFNLGATYASMGFVDQALIELDNAVRLNPDAAPAAGRSRAYSALSGNEAFQAIVNGRGALYGRRDARATILDA